MEEINSLGPVFVFSKKYYSGKELVIELLAVDNSKIHTKFEITFKDGEDVFKFGKKYRITFREILEKE